MRSGVVLLAAVAVAGAAAVALSAQDSGPGITYRSGPLPPLPAQAVGGGEVFLEVTVSAEGRVTSVAPLRTTPPFTDLVIGAVRAWTFDSGTEERILVAAVFRPPAIQGPTLGELPRDVAPGSNRIPFPVGTVLPAFPPMARASGVVLVETRVDATGRVIRATVRQSAPPFDDAARAAAQLWRFRPALMDGRPVASVAYLLLGFPLPVTNASFDREDSRRSTRQPFSRLDPRAVITSRRSISTSSGASPSSCSGRAVARKARRTN